MTTRNQRDLDNLLAEGGGELGALYGRLSKAQPPRRLDRQILAEASRAVHGRPKGARWLLGFGTAAGVLLAAGIAWRVNTDLVRQREGVNVSAPAATAPPATGVDVIPIQAHELPAGRASGAPTISSKGFDEASNVVETGSRIATPSPSEATRDAASASRRKAEAVKRSDDVRSIGAAKEAPRLAEPEAFAPPSPPPAPPAPAAMATQADAAPAATEAETLPTPVVPAPLARQSTTAAAAADVAALAEQRDEAKAALPDAGNAHDVAIARIRALLAANRRDDALAAMRELRRQHPAVVLPDDLRALER